MKALNQAIEILGSATALAEKLKIRQSAVSNWIIRGSVPANQCLHIERATNGAVKCHELRPDVFPAPKQEAAA